MTEVTAQPWFLEAECIADAGGAEQDQPRVERPQARDGLERRHGLIGLHRSEHLRVEVSCERALGDAAQAFDALRLQARERIQAKQPVRQRERVLDLPVELERDAERLAEPPPQRGCLAPVPALRHHRPGRGLVRGVKEHRAQPGVLGLQPAEHRVPAARRDPAVGRAVHGQNAAQLPLHRRDVAGAADVSDQAAARLLPDQYARLVPQVVGHEREPHHRVAVRGRPARIRAESKRRGGRQRERPVDRHVQVLGHGHPRWLSHGYPHDRVVAAGYDNPRRPSPLAVS